MQEDRWQTVNMAGTPGFAAAVIQEYAGIAAALGACRGDGCHVPTSAASAVQACYPVMTSKNVYSGSWSFLPDPKTKEITSMHGWAVDFLLDGPPASSKPRGFDPVTVRLVDGQGRVPGVPDQVANISRPDIMHHGGLPIPNADHGFQFELPTSLLAAPMVHVGMVMVDSSGAHHQFPTGATTWQCLCSGKECPCSTDV